MTRVSVVTVSLNQAAFLERAIRSVVDQDYDDIEYVIVDAGSTDGSREIIERHKDAFARVIFEPDHGPADGLNRALSHATGDVFACVNSDDALLPGAVREAVRAFEQHPSADAVYASGYFVDGDGCVIRRFRSTRFGLHRFARGAVNVMHQATFVRRDAFLSVGGFNAANRTCWDGELIADLALAGHKLVRVPGVWGTFTMHPESISGSGHLDRLYDVDRRRIFEKVFGRPPRAADRLWLVPIRIAKWVLDPSYLVWRIVDVLRLPKTQRALS